MITQYEENDFETYKQIQFLFDTTPLACQLWDKDFNILLSNDENTKLFKIRDKQIFHGNFFRFSPEFQADGRRSDDKISSLLNKAFENGKCVFKWRFKTLEGTSIPSKVTLIRITYKKEPAVIAYVNDLREHNQLIGEIAKRDNLLHAVNDVAATLLSYKDGSFEDTLQKGIERISNRVNVDRAYIWKNQIFDNKLYYKNLYEWVENNKGRGLIVHPDMKYPYDKTPRWEDELRHNRCLNGPIRDLPDNEKNVLFPYNIKSILVIPVHLDTEFWGFISFDDCKSERRFSYDEVNILRSASLIIANAIIKYEMTNDIVGTSEKLADALQKAQDANNAKSNFLSTMSHEIRTPMNAIIGMTEIGKAAVHKEKMLYALDKIDDVSKHLLGVINDVLDISKIEANKLILSKVEFNFEKMIESIVHIIRFKAEEKHQKLYVSIDKDIPSTLNGDDQRLSQVVANLLSNAVKFTSHGGSIHLTAKLDKIDGNTCILKISVKDSGIGIRKEQQAKLFSSFQQAESGISRRYGGTGLGLAISKHIVELMNGEIWIDSDVDEGATFNFTVKLEQAMHKSDDPSISANIDIDNLHLLLVSEDTEISDYFLRLTDRLGVSCDIASTFKTALSLIHGDLPYDICFLDWDMLEENRHRLSKRFFVKHGIKSKLAMISWYNRGFVDQNHNLDSIDVFLAKPLFKSNIVQCINKCLIANPIRQEKVFVDNNIVSLKGYRLLLVDDLEINREIVLSMLEPTKIEIDCAQNGLEAVELYENNDIYDIILMDIQMPVMDGHKATKIIREIESKRQKKTSIIAMTANVFREDIEKCLKSGMDDHMGKPIDKNKLLDTLYGILTKDNVIVS